MQQLAYFGEILAARWVREQTVMSNAVEAARQHVKQEPTYEFVRFERHCLVPCASIHAIVLPAEGDAALIERNESLVGDGHAMRLA